MHFLQQFLPYFTLGIEIPVTAPYMGTLFYKLKTAYDSGDRQAAQTIQVSKPYIDTVKRDNTYILIKVPGLNYHMNTI